MLRALRGSAAPRERWSVTSEQRSSAFKPKHASSSGVKVEVWSDVACPFCWLGEHHLLEAARRSGEPIEVEFRSFELQPNAQSSRPVREYLAEKYGSTAGIDAAHARLAASGRAVGIAYDFERALMANTFDAHRLHHLAKARGIGGAVMERFLRARQGEGADMAHHATLRALAVEAGLDGADVDRVLSSDEFAAEVRADEEQARAYNIRGVPFFVFDGRLAVSGAQPIEVFEQAIAQAKATGPAISR